ncbi:Helix-turn-helix protein [Streptomyces sp. YIM 121038]|uniref:helix-turn-helix domain-containing protein n=1 Tax=Streptomyces sp. YIM 121038 TaxID=2136401 RepID=UPI00111064C8|nr:helix-turn-helix transcriptional regulator [Streptomyces sp. YIM 121038]QCX75481.1 Helix-turn-helix protein [Streptomyces sp. YIM 121038]
MAAPPAVRYSSTPQYGTRSAIAEAVLAHMQLRGETQEQVARAIGVTQPSIHRYVTGQTGVRAEHLMPLAEHWGVPVTSLLGLDRIEAETITGR